jgi:hypothetical protein
MNNITIPSCFISTFVKKKEIAALILALQMTQTPSSLKNKVEIVLDVSHFNFAHTWPSCFLSILCILPN